MNILKVIAGLLLPMILAAQRPLSGFLNLGSTTLSGNYSIVFRSHDLDRGHRLKLSMTPAFSDREAALSGDDGSCRRGQGAESCSALRAMFRT
ncbi:MAG TPA: hypothetical protein VFO10_08255 [Oligoflexus sp.]|uniref:hypothetical protein n=1 Tax=Oligoflexus sp. TaxID=1971216 RepID=UPI002D7E4C4A|nr:hypothetical protein [Oligoflexus sp.]HET9237229.1 hypothetical protein [Oligoflexus sp.]